jgi:hypothetical protein
MSLIYRMEKGGPLTAQEVDDNFRQLDVRLKDLEQRNPERKLNHIKLENDHIILYDQAGVEISRAKIPVISLNPRGHWQPYEAYARNDLITYQNVVHLCMRSHKPGDFEEENWQLLFKTQEVKHDEK